MKNLIRLAAVAAFVAVCAFAQNTTAVSASNITDAAGTKLAAGQICFLGTDQNNQPINFQVGGGGQVLKRPVCAAVTSGAVAGGFSVPNPANTSPAGVLYRVTVTDSSTGLIVLQYAGVAFTGSSFDLDNYQPSGIPVPPPPVPAAVAGPLNVSGNFSATGTSTLGVTNIPGGAVNPTSLQAVQYENNFAGSTLAVRVAAACTASGGSGIVVTPPSETSIDAPVTPASCTLIDERGNTGNGAILWSRHTHGNEQYGFAFAQQNLASDGQSATAILGEVPSGVSGANVTGVRGQVYSAGSAGVYGINFGSGGNGGTGVQGDVTNLPGSVGVRGTGCTSGGIAANPCVGIFGSVTGNPVYDGNVAGLFENDNGKPLVADLTDVGGVIDPTVIKAQSAEPTNTTISIVNSSSGGKRWDLQSTGASDSCTGEAGDLAIYDQTDNKCSGYWSSGGLILFSSKVMSLGGFPSGTAPLNVGTGSSSFGRVITLGTTAGALAGINVNASGYCITVSGGSDLCGTPTGVSTGLPFSAPAITNACSGVSAAMVAGTVTVSNACITGARPISLVAAAKGGTQGFLSYTQSAGSLVITSTSNTDTSTVSWVQN